MVMLASPSLYLSWPLAPNPKHIRVFNVDQADRIDQPWRSSEEPRKINGTLRVVDLQKNPRFSALSYVCGVDPHGESFSVLCGGEAKPIPVTENYFIALWHLRKKLGAFTIWVDSICINRADSREKEWQIQQMGRIFAHAETVYVWLGRATDQSDRAMRYLATASFQKLYHESGPRVWAAVWSLYSASSGSFLPKSGILKDSPVSRVIFTSPPSVLIVAQSNRSVQTMAHIAISKPDRPQAAIGKTSLDESGRDASGLTRKFFSHNARY